MSVNMAYVKSQLNRDIYEACPPGGESIYLPAHFVQAWLDQRAERGHPMYCPWGHEVCIENTRVRVRYRKDGHGSSIEQDCRLCKRDRYRGTKPETMGFSQRGR